METLPAKIYLNELRGNELINNSDSFSTLQHFSGSTIVAGGCFKPQLNSNSYLIIVPLTGDLFFKTACKDHSSGYETEINVGQLLITRGTALSPIQLYNPFENESVAFLWMNIVADDQDFAEVWLGDFDPHLEKDFVSLLDTKSNTLPFGIHMKQFKGREEKIFTTTGGYQSVFCYAIAGAFEVCGRLMHPKDGLALWDVSEIDIEALSNDALMFLIEIP